MVDAGLIGPAGGPAARRLPADRQLPTTIYFYVRESTYHVPRTSTGALATEVRGKMKTATAKPDLEAAGPTGYVDFSDGSVLGLCPGEIYSLRIEVPNYLEYPLQAPSVQKTSFSCRPNMIQEGARTLHPHEQRWVQNVPVEALLLAASGRHWVRVGTTQPVGVQIDGEPGARLLARTIASKAFWPNGERRLSTERELTDAEWRRCSAGAERLTMNHYVHVPDEFAYYRPARPEGRARNQTRQTVERVYGSPYRDPAQRNLPWDETTRGQAAHSNRTDWRESQQRSQEWSGGTSCARGIYDA